MGKIISKRGRLFGFIPFFILLLLLPFNTRSQEVSISTNLIGYINFGTINGEFGLSLAPKWSVYFQGRYNPFTFKNRKRTMPNGYPFQMQNRHVSAAAGVKYWFWHVNSGWFLSSRLSYTKYNVGGIRKNDTYQGQAGGITFGAGYSLMLSEHLNLEFGLGMMCGFTSYIKYACPRCGEITGRDKKIFIAPGNVLLQLSYVF